LLEEALGRARKLSGPMPPRLEWVVGALAAAYDGGGQYARSEPLHRECVELARERHQADSPRIANALSLLGRSLLRQRRCAEAEPILRECLAIREKVAPRNWRTFEAKALLGGALLGQKKYADAGPLLAGYRGMSGR